MKKLIPVILCLVLLLGAFTVAVSAASKTQDGIEATLTLNKAEYAANESISVTLNVKNTASETVKNVQTEIVLPSGVSLSSGNLKQGAFDLAANETKTATVTAAAKKAASSTGSSTSVSGSPQTGDESVILAAALMIVSGAVLVLAIKNKWIGGKGMMSVLLCVVMLGSCLLPMAVSADSAKKELTVQETVKIAGSSAVIKAVVSYDAPASAGNNDSDSNNNNVAPDTNTPNTDSGNEGDDTTAVQKPVDTNPAGEEILGEGSIDTPYMEIPDENMTVTTVAVPAGGVLYYEIYRVGGMILTINDANAFVEYNGARYDAENGSVVIWLENALASDAVSFAFGNNGSSDASFLVEFSNPTGSYQNPTIIETMGEENSVSLEEGNEVGHYYKYYAEQAGTLRFYMTASVDSIIVVTNNRNSAQRSNDTDEVFTDENGAEYIEIEVEAGDELIITVGAKPNKRNKYPATDITWSGKFF